MTLMAITGGELMPVAAFTALPVEAQQAPSEPAPQAVLPIAAAETPNEQDSDGPNARDIVVLYVNSTRRLLSVARSRRQSAVRGRIAVARARAGLAMREISWNDPEKSV